jgi:tetraprenyl-beta-curcumene synthase
LLAATRELVWGLRLGSREIRLWRLRALQIPDAQIREDALAALDHKRTHAHGAALFWTLPRRRNPHLLRLLIAYELIWDFLDNLSERAAALGQTDGRDLHRAITEAIDPTSPISNYYRQLPWREDGGYLRALVEACRQRCLLLPSYSTVRTLMLEDACLAQVLALNHHPNAGVRDAELQSWVSRHFPEASDMPWWELSGAASAPLTIHVLLALAAEPDCSVREVIEVHQVYFPCLSATTTMLDSFVDQADDVANGNHSYVGHYPDGTDVVQSVQRLVRQSMQQVGSLKRGAKHAIIAAAMISMYLSKSSSGQRHSRLRARRLVRSGGSLTRVLLPILRLWRIAFQQRAA